MENWLDLSELIEKVQEFLDIGFYDEGMALLDHYKDIYNNQWEIYFLYSRVYAEQGKPQEAVAQLKTALRLNKDNADCLLALFSAYTQMQQIQKGARYLLKAGKLYPSNELIINALIWYYSETSDFAKAVECYENAESILGYNPEALRNVGISYERMGNFDKALNSYKVSLELDPDADETRDLLADHYIFRGDVAKSIELYKSYLKISPNNIRSMSRLVFCLSQNGQLQEAEKAARDIIAIYPNSPVGYVDLSYAFLNNNNPQKAIEIADKALDVSPIDAEALRVKGIAYTEQKKDSLAEKAFRKAYSLAPENPEVMRDYYHYLRNAEKHKEMERLVLQVIRQEYPYCMEDYWFLADYYRDKGQSIKAFHYLNKAYHCMPQEKDILPPMVEILFDKGHTSFATPILKRYIEAKGWDSVMRGFTKHEQMKGKQAQEGLRFLQFYGQKPIEFRNFIFGYYVRKLVLVSFCILSAVVLGLSYMYFNYKGLILAGTLYVTTVASFKGTTYWINRKRFSR